jgi:hypothetical protein
MGADLSGNAEQLGTELRVVHPLRVSGAQGRQGEFCAICVAYVLDQCGTRRVYGKPFEKSLPAAEHHMGDGHSAPFVLSKEETYDLLILLS